METPSSSRRVTRSQALAASNDALITISRKIEDSEKNASKSKSRGCALIDITNDSPIVGLASGANLETPLTKQRGSRVKNTPGSGEALLRGQVKTLLQKVEEEGMGLLVPTHVNTPQIQNLSDMSSVTPFIVLQQPLIPQVVNHDLDGKNQEDSESEKSVISRSLLLDFSEKSQLSDASSEGYSSELSYEEVVQGEEMGSCNINKPKATTEDDDASIWSMQVNASTHDEDDDNEEEEVDEDEDYYEDIEEEYDEGGLLLDELCEGLNNISVNERILPKFEGKHTRFVYNSDDELVKEDVEENSGESESSSPNMLRLKGLPTPKGKHLRFYEEEEGKFAL